MSIEINSYQASATTQSTSSAGSATTDLSMQDFLELLAAQMSNQDVMDPENNTDFIGQMAQFTTLQMMQKLTEINYANYGASMIGKTVIVAGMNSDGSVSEEQGVVENVSFYGGSCVLTVNGEQYDLSAVMEILASDTSETE